MATIEEHKRLKKRLEDIGIQVTVAYTPQPLFTLRYSFIRVESLAADEALFQFLSELIKFVPVEQAEARQAKPETSYLDDPTRVDPGWLGETYNE